MRVLVSNDDGVDAPGIKMLAEELRNAGHEVTVVAPDRDRSGASNSLTLDQPVRLRRIDHYTCAVAGTPTDCADSQVTITYNPAGRVLSNTSPVQIFLYNNSKRLCVIH